MAIVTNFWLKGAKKRLAGAVLYEAMGQTRARELASTVSNPRTQAQMTQRIKWSNLVNFYRANASWMKYAFESKASNQSEYNKFMSLNVTGSPVALTKDMAAAGASIVCPYIVTQGSLPSIEWRNSVEELRSNIFLPPGTTLEDYTTVGTFAAALIQANAGLREGDQLSLVRMSQLTNNNTGYPYMVARAYEVLLDKQSTALLSDYMPTDFFNSDGADTDNTLNVNKTNRQGGFVMIISRTLGGRTYVSTQSVLIVNNETLIATYSQASAVQAAIDSYGRGTEVFLSASYANGLSNQPVGLAINYVTFPDGPLTAGAQTPNWGALEGETIGIVFSDALTNVTGVAAKVKWTDGSLSTITDPVAQLNTIYLPIPAPGVGKADYHLLDITITINSVDYNIRFASASSYTIQGLE